MSGISKEALFFRAFLIGQLSKNYLISNNPINLQEILDQIYSVLMEAQDKIGGRLILLECDKNQSLVNHYKRHQFSVLQASTDNDLLQMYQVFSK